MSEERKLKNIEQFVQLENKHDNGNIPYIVKFVLMSLHHQVEFLQTLESFYHGRFDWTGNEGEMFPKKVSLTIQPKDFALAQNTPLDDDL